MRDSIAQYRRLFETAQDGFLIVNAETGLIVDVNPSLSDLLKYPRSRFIGEKIWELGFFNHIVASRENFVKLQQQEHTRFERVPLESAAGRRMEVDLVSNVYLVDAQRAMHWHIRDVTERSQAEARINLQLSALNATANAIAITDRECSIEWVNPAFSALTGYRASEVIGTSIGVLKSRAQPLEFYVDLWAALQAGKVWREEVESKRKDGQCYMEEVTITPVPGPDGQPARFVVVKQNITERKRAAERIQRLNRTYEVLSEINTIIVREKDPMKMLNTACGIAVDKGLFRMAWVGFPDAQSTRMNVVAQAGDTQDYLENLRMTLLDEPRGRGPSAQALRSGRHVICNNIEQDSRMAPWREAAQRMGFRSLAALPLTVESRPVGVLTLYSGFTEFFDPEEMRLLDELAADMSFALEVSQRETERGKSEEELRWRTAFFEALVESAQDGILVVDVHGNRILQNDRMVSLWKIPRHLAEDRDISAQFAFARGTTKNPEQFEDKVAFLYAHPDEISQDEVELIDGTILEQYSSPVRDKAGRYYGRIWVFRDITERKRLNQQLLRAQRMESIGTLAGGIAHDLNNVLGPIILARWTCFKLKMTRSRQRGPRAARSPCEVSARRGASTWLSQVLSFARGVEGRRVELAPSNSVLRETARSIARRHLSQARPSSVPSSAPEDSWNLLVADPTQLHQVLLNLCVNARDAMPDGGKLTPQRRKSPSSTRTLLAMQRRRRRPGPYLVLEVADTGAGNAAG
jgi:PAS domain S-box-containing protein